MQINLGQRRQKRIHQRYSEPRVLRGTPLKIQQKATCNKYYLYLKESILQIIDQLIMLLNKDT